MNRLTFVFLSYCLLQPYYNHAQPTPPQVNSQHVQEQPSKQEETLSPGEILRMLCAFPVLLIIFAGAWIAEESSRKHDRQIAHCMARAKEEKEKEHSLRYFS